jgi:hypothetical protein
VKVWSSPDEVDGYGVAIECRERYAASQLVTELMLLANEAIAMYGVANDIPMPFRSQDVQEVTDLELDCTPEGPCRSWLAIRSTSRSRVSSTPDPHGGLGLDMYVQATSPVRRYADFALHHQLKAVGTYTLDFGNVVAGLKKEVQFKMWNVGKMPFNLQFDQKNIKSAGFTLSHDKIARFNYKDNNWITLKILYQTRKNSPPGKAKYILPIEISNGPRYLLEIITNVTVPDISVSTNDIDFGAVICGMKKTMYIRFENQKEVPCIWTLNLKEERTVAHEREKKGEPRFTMTQTSGTMPKYTKSTIEISFVPIAEKSYQQKFMIEITDNTRKCEIVCRGFGVTPNLEFFPPEMIFAPSLPYDEKV